METEKAELLQKAALFEAEAAQIDRDMPELLRALELVEKRGLSVTRVADGEKGDGK